MGVAFVVGGVGGVGRVEGVGSVGFMCGFSRIRWGGGLGALGVGAGVLAACGDVARWQLGLGLGFRLVLGWAKFFLSRHERYAKIPFGWVAATRMASGS
ncbi:MAG: hypothetical protein DDT34_02496 [Firmicutes bacterium]|nr:hypothetical protein [Bacillota bacterium]